MKNKEKRTQGMGKILLKMLIFALIGGVIGGFLGFFLFPATGLSVPERMVHFVQHMILPGMILLTVLNVLLQEIYFKRLKGICMRLETADDDEFHQLDYEEEKTGAALQTINVVIQVATIVLLSFGYSLDYLSSKGMTALVACVIFLLCIFYNGTAQARYIKLLQKVHPEKKGDISSSKFHQQWLDSCDEAEKKVVYQSAYKSFMVVNKLIGILLVVTMIAHLLFHTGILAIVVVGIVYLVQSLVYYKSCVELKKDKI